MSTLTKVLIVLLTIASIFLCGIVVTYVASADNYKEMYDQRASSERRARQQKDQITEEWNTEKANMDQERTNLNNQIAGLQEQIRTLNGQVADLTAQNVEAQRRKENYESLLAAHAKTGELHAQLQKKAQDEQVALEAEKTRLEDQLEDVTKALRETQAIVMQQKADLKGLVEEKTALQNKLDEFLKQYGKVTAQAAPVTVLREAAQIAPAATDIGLKGSLTEVDLKNNIATLSIGSAAGVKPNMRFHITRNSKFVCDVVILDVEPDESVGWLELVQAGAQDKPITGDGVSTNL